MMPLWRSGWKGSPSGDAFLIGGADSFTSPASGYLYLTVNDNLGFYADNLSGFTVLLSSE
jgi:hypothetical protein